MSARNARRISPLSRPPRKNTSSMRMFHARNVLMTRSWPGALRVLDRAPRQRTQGGIRFAACECCEPFFLIDPLGLVGEEHRVTVESDSQSIGFVRRAGARENRCRRVPVVESAPDVSGVGGQEQVGAERRDI